MEARTISKITEDLACAERAIYMDWERRMTSSCNLEAQISRLLLDESQQYLTALDAWQSQTSETVQIERDESKWQSLTAMVEKTRLWQQHNLLRQVKVSIQLTVELIEQAKKNYPYAAEQLFLEGLLYEKKKSRRKVDELLRYVQNRLWEQIGFAPYIY